MHTNKTTIADSPYEEARSELRAAVPSLQAIADRAFALAAGRSSEARAVTSSGSASGRSI
jgi:Tfp pilus assembly protein PilW